MKITENTEGRFYKEGTRYNITREDGDTQLPFAYARENGYILYDRYERMQENLPNLKRLKKRDIKFKCKEEYTSRLTTSDGFVFNTDPETIIDVQAIIASLSTATSKFRGYKNADGTYNDITRAQFQRALDEGMQRKIQAFAKRKELEEQIDTLTEAQEVIKIDW